MDDHDSATLPLLVELLQSCERSLAESENVATLEGKRDELQELLSSGEIHGLIRNELMHLASDGIRTPPASNGTGFWGCGYGTEIYELDVDRVIGYPGEDVGLEFLERTTLPEGKVMYYRRSLDVHTQLPPESFSISLNLMPADRLIGITEQYDFNIADRKIRDIVGGQVEAQVSLLTIALHVGDDRTLELCSDIAADSPNHRTRLAAYRCAAALSGTNVARLWRQAADDKHASVRHHARAALRELELGA